MSGILRPRKEILTPAGKALWGQLSPLGRMGFVLYGGTAIALRLGHRQSVDFDFFTHSLHPEKELRRNLPFLNEAQALQQTPDTLSVLVPTAHGEVKVSLFQDIHHGRLASPAPTQDGIVCVASVEDLLATKLKVLLQRIEAKDYEDIAALLRHGTSLERGLAGAQTLYGEAFPTSDALKALTYFHGGDLDTLPEEARKTLLEAASQIGEIPQLPIDSLHLGEQPRGDPEPDPDEAPDDPSPPAG